MDLKILIFMVISASVFPYVHSKAKCINGDLSGTQNRAIRRASDQIDALEALLTYENVNITSSQILFSPPIVQLNSKQTGQTRDIYGSLFRAYDEPTTVAYAGGVSHGGRRPTPHSIPSETVRDTNVNHPPRHGHHHGGPGGKSARSGPGGRGHHSGKAGPGGRGKRAIQGFEVRICNDPDTVRESINYARDSDGNIVQIVQFGDDEYQAIENQIECPRNIVVPNGENVVCRRQLVEVPAVVIPLRRNRSIRLTNISVPRCFAFSVVEQG